MILPLPFESRMQRQLGDHFPLFIEALNSETPISIRLNPKKLSLAPNLEKVNWCENGYYLNKRPLFSSDPLWHCGAYYVQEASSMALEKAFIQVRQAIHEPLKVLDLCAAPGGKSSHLANLLDDNDILVANEVIRSRVGILSENLMKNGYPNCVITNSDSAEFVSTGAIFDLIVVDAPCSGEGLFRKDPNAVNEWSEDNVQTCELRQKRILENIVQSIKPGGFLVYSTCTYNPGENQNQINTLLQKGFERVNFEINNQWASEFQLMPHQVKGEGFFIALLRKIDGVNETPDLKIKPAFKTIKKDDAFSGWVKHEGPFIEFRNDIHAVSEHLLDFCNNRLTGLNLVAVGTNIGKAKDKLFQVSDKLPFSLILNTEAFDSLHLDQVDSLNYLANNSLPFNDRSKKGYVLLNYENLPIGLGKYAGNRINNLYPNEWRLRKMPAPADFFKLPF